MMQKLFAQYPWLSRVMAMDFILVLCLIDQIHKWFMLERIIRPAITGVWSGGLDFITWITALSLPRYDFIAIPVYSFFNVVMVWNQGISFGFFADQPAAANGILLAALCGIVIGFGIWMMRTPDHVIRFILAAIIGGALGNLWDRVRFGAVADFLDFHAFGWHYPAFNIADSLIVLGVIALIVYETFGRPRVQEKPTS